jgi:hypothetical protein
MPVGHGSEITGHVPEMVGHDAEITGHALPKYAPTDLGAYKAHFDVLMTAFGRDRLIWGSNWPVITLHGTFEAQIAIAEEVPRAIRHRRA